MIYFKKASQMHALSRQYCIKHTSEMSHVACCKQLCFFIGSFFLFSFSIVSLTLKMSRKNSRKKNQLNYIHMNNNKLSRKAE